MPRYLIERTFSEECPIPDPGSSAQDSLIFIENNTRLGVVWIHSYISRNRKKSYCLYDAPSPEVLRRSAQTNGLPIDRITEIYVLGPFGPFTS